MLAIIPQTLSLLFGDRVAHVPEPEELTCLQLPVMGSQAHTTLLGFLIRFWEFNGRPHAST